MEIFAFTHVAVDYEAPGATPHLREFSLDVPIGVITGIASPIAALSVVGFAPDAQALIQRGDVCAEVGNIQQALVNLDYSIGNVDNVFGPSTERAVRSYQSSEELLVDGVVGPATAAALGVTGSCDDSVADEMESSSFAVVDASGLNVRTGSSTADDIITSLPRGTRVEVTDTRDGWSAIITGSTEGWVSSQYLSAEDTTEENTDVSTDSETADSYTVTSSGLNVRSTPNGAYQYTLANGATVSLTSRRQEAGGFTWGELTTGGWVATTYLSGGGSTGGGTGTSYVVDTASDSGVLVRSAPNGAVVGSLGEGASVSVTNIRQMSGGYTWVQLVGGNWVATAFLQ